MRALLPPLVSTAAAILWCLLLGAIGARLRRMARIPVGPALRLPVDLVLGAWGLAAAFLLCGLCGLFRPGVLLLAAGGLAAGGRWRGQARSWKPAVPVLVPALLFLPMALAIPFFYDALVYHLGLPWQALQEGRLSPHPENLFAAFPPLVQLVAAGPLAAGLERVPALLHLASFVAASAAGAALALRLGAPRPLARLAGAALPILPAIAPVPGFPAAEGWAAAPLVAALAVTLGGHERPGREERGRAFLAGLLAGVAAAARLQGIAWGGIVIALVAARSRCAPLRQTSVATAGCLLGSAPWWLKNLALLGDPVAPIGWRREGIEVIWREAGANLRFLAGWRGWPAQLASTLGSHLLYVVPLVLAALLALRSGRDRRRSLLGGAVLLGAAAWWLTGSVPRFLAPTLAALLALAAAAGTTRAGKIAAGAALAWAAALGLLVTVHWAVSLGGPRLAFARPGDPVGDLVVNDPVAAFTAAGALPHDARVLFVGEARGYSFPRRFVAPSPYDPSPLRQPLEELPSARAACDWLAAQGYTHLLVNRAELVRLAAGYPVVVPWKSPAGQKRFQELLDLAAPPSIKVGEVGIFALPCRAAPR